MNTTRYVLAVGIFLTALGTGFGQPVITNQPRIQAVAPGGSATFTVGASGPAPLAYQWQRNPGAGFSDLAERTNTVLTLTNVQPWDAAHYRVVVTNVSGARTSAAAYLYVMSPAMRTNREVIDNFDDNILTGWNTWSSNGQGLLKETNGQFTVLGYWPGVPAKLGDRWAKGWKNFNPRNLVEGQRLERRVDLIKMSASTTAVNIGITGDSLAHGYVLTHGRGWVAIHKWLPGFAVLALDPANLPDENVVLSLALTRVQQNLLVTARILEKGGQEAVLFEKSVWDTPAVDPTISSNQFYDLTGLSHSWLADTSGTPGFTFDYLDLEIFNVNDGPNPAAEVTFDNCEIWTYRLPITRYVWQDSPSPTPPYTTWATAATNIQDAVDVAVAGDEIIVNNGVYATGGRSVSGSMTNRVAVTKPLVVRSVNGPEVTIIKGYQVPSTTNGDGAVRCAYLTNEAFLVGFTLTNGATRTAGDFELEQSGGGVWCEITAVVSNCVMTGNSARSVGGGDYSGTLYNCTLTGNSASDTGGGACSATLNNCTIGNNSASGAGGVMRCIVNNCTLSGNSAGSGGGAGESTLNNCTLIANSASYEGGGAYYGTLKNCIIYYNSAPKGPNYYGYSITMVYCCTTPLPGGEGNFEAHPQLASVSHLSSLSPCRGAGSADYAGGTDIDGEHWSNPPSIGCDEFDAAEVTGPLTVRIQADYSKVTVGFSASFTAVNDGRLTISRWEFEDGTIISNRPYATHSWNVPGDYQVVLRGYNDSNPGGVSASVMVRVVAQPVHYVALDSLTPEYPYDSWARAATNIQDVVDAATVPGALVLVSNGVYQTGGRVLMGSMTNRVVVTKPLVLRSVNGPEVTIIKGYQVPGTTNGDSAVRCAYLANGASLVGFTLSNGATRTYGADSEFERSGGGVWCGYRAGLSNCVLTGNSADWSAGGAYYGQLDNCTLTGNAAVYGGGANNSTLNNCALTANWASSSGGGVSGGTLNNCILTSNSVTRTRGFGGGAHYATLTNCVLAGNSAMLLNAEGGGAYAGMLNNCTITNNRAYSGGGTCGSTLFYCFLSGNSASTGGAASLGTLNDCILTTNSAGSGGGAYLATLSRCTLTGNVASSSGGGASGGALNYCTLTGNSAGDGGGANNSALNNCMLTGNSAAWSGGATWGGRLTNCTLTGNSSAIWWGGAGGGSLNNCIIYSNSAPNGPNYSDDSSATLNYCCTTPPPATPLPPWWRTGNITNAPLFVDYAGGNLRLQSNSPCINAGNNAYATGSTDLAGNPRNVSGTVDIGAYEFQGTGSTISYAWLQQFGLPTDGSADAADLDGDGHSTWQEWRCQTCPTNTMSSLRLLTAAPTGNNLTVNWQSVAGVNYFLERSTNLASNPSFTRLATSIPGKAGTTTYTDTNTAALTQRFYRVGVQP